jgi:hypothetical protein
MRRLDGDLTRRVLLPALARGLSLCVAVAGLAVAGLSTSATVALAACHHFSVSATPNRPSEGQTVTVTVSRDGAVGPSNIDISTVDETAKAGQDYTALHQTVSFTNETSQAFSVRILDDRLTGEPVQTFRLHLSNPGGCAVNPRFVVDPDVVVTLADDDPVAASTPPQPTHSSPPAVPRATPSTEPVPPPASPSALPSAQAVLPPTPSPLSSENPTPTASAQPNGAGAVDHKTAGRPGLGLPWIAGLLLVLGALGAGAYYIRRTRA